MGSRRLNATMDLSKWNLDIFGDSRPSGDPAWYQGQYSPYYNDSHREIRAFIRDFVEENIMPHAMQWDDVDREIPKRIYELMGEAGINFLSQGHPFPVGYGQPPECLRDDSIQMDPFHEFIVVDELARTGSCGIMMGLSGGIALGLPPVLRFGTDELKQRVVPQCLQGEKIICLTITEPSAGSDVANLRCRADRTPDGQHFIVNGEKKWITNGCWADYFTVAVVTGEEGSGAKGLSMLLVEKCEGVRTRRMDCSGAWCSGTTYVTFEDVEVPVSNLIGRENKGFSQMMSNFNHERLIVCMMANRFARVCLEESIAYATKRKTFGKPLIQHQVIRWKVGEMMRQVEATHSWLEHLCYNVHKMEKAEADMKLGGMTALAKVQCTKVFEYCARESAQIFGGLSYTRGGQGEKVERMNREVRAMAVPGGSEEIMLDLGVKQSLKVAQMSSGM